MSPTPIPDPTQLRLLTYDLETSLWTLVAIGVLFESGLADRLREPQTVDALAAQAPGMSRGRLQRTLDVLAVAGVVVADGARYRLADGAMPYLGQPMRAGLEGDIRSHLMQSLVYLDSSSGGDASEGWRHTDPAILQAQGDASALFPLMLRGPVAASLGDLTARLERPGARFLDVGTGVAALAIAMARSWPQLHVVGLDVLDAPLAIARRNVARADLTARVELRQLGVQHLRDEACFDLAWLPSFFIPAAHLPAAITRVAASLRPGGWVIIPISTGPDERQRAMRNLVVEMWGGASFSSAEAEALLTQAGLASVRATPGPMVVGQRAAG